MISKYVTNTYEITDSYKKIQLLAKNAKVKIEPSDDDSTALTVFAKKRYPYGFSLRDGVLTIESQKKKWFHLLRVGVDHSEIKLCIPKSRLQGLYVQTNVGTVNISSIMCNGSIDVQVNTGKVNICDIFCQSFVSKGNTGSVTLEKLSAAESVSIKCNTGKIILNDCNAPNFFLRSNTGSISGKLPSGTAFVTKTNTGKIEIPEIAIGEAICARCEIKTNTGNIKFE